MRDFDYPFPVLLECSTAVADGLEPALLRRRERVFRPVKAVPPVLTTCRQGLRGLRFARGCLCHAVQRISPLRKKDIPMRRSRQTAPHIQLEAA